MNLTNYTNEDLKLGLMLGTLPARVHAADGTFVDVISVPVSREEIEAELAKPGRMPDPVLMGNFLGFVRDWMDERDAAVAGGAREVVSMNTSIQHGGR